MARVLCLSRCLPQHFKSKFNNVVKLQARWLNLLECHSKDLLQMHGASVQKFVIADSMETAEKVKDIFKVNEYVVKAQILAGGRGLGHFDNGFKSGVHVIKDPGKLSSILKNMIGHKLITKQTPSTGILVKKVMVAESVDIKRETYFCILMDRENNGPIIIASPAGGTDIEAVAKDRLHLINTYPIDIFEGVTEELANRIAKFLHFEGPLLPKASIQIQKLWAVFLKVDAIQLEINPLVETVQGDIVSVDAKIQFDDNARFRQEDIFALGEISELDPREVRAAELKLNYIGLTGNIGCLVNGAGLAMATMDIIKLHGGDPANFLDVGGGVNEEQVLSAFHILTSDSHVKSILVNVFGGIVNCAIVAKGIINATRSLQLNVPLIVRLEGTNVKEARQLLVDSGLRIDFASDLDQAAQKAVKSVN